MAQSKDLASFGACVESQILLNIDSMAPIVAFGTCFVMAAIIPFGLTEYDMWSSVPEMRVLFQSFNL